jgi:hypothetical protein
VLSLEELDRLRSAVIAKSVRKLRLPAVIAATDL